MGVDLGAISIKITMRNFRPVIFSVSFVVTVALAISGCRLQYQGETFTLNILPGGAGELTVTYKNFGSEETESHYRNLDLDDIQSMFNDKKYVRQALEKGVVIKKRRLDFVEYVLNGYVEASAKSYEDLFKVFTNYKLVIEDRIYLTPMNGTVLRAVLSDGGEIIIKDNRYAFAWPKGTTKISFNASYKVKGISFRNELRKKFENK